MRIDYCPKCHKAGLKYTEVTAEDPKGYGIVPNEHKWDKWCPRCKQWVTPINKPYVGVRGVS